MYNRDIKELYDKVPVGTPVIIRNGDYGPFGTGFRELKPGDRGADVLAIQQRLKELGYFSSKETGIYDDDMKKAIYRFQKSNNLKIKYTITYEDYRALGFSELE
jgi:peptidoglycan hydrolase-like protein with peptidoglycan-binding domain